ncbi:MAG: arylsulfatase [Phycisphaerales bacterium]|nr:arylsulfatase [Phycisphaerales bacterium]
MMKTPRFVAVQRLGCRIAAAVSLVLGGQASGDARPNVLLILVDDMGYSDPGFMGGEIPTPSLDRLASGGLRFTQCTTSARCCPSRASLMTGLYPHQAGIGSFATARPGDKGPAYLGHLNDQCVTLAEVLGDAGYRTSMVGKWHMEEPGPIARGFDEFYGFVHGYEQDQWDPTRYQRLPEGREVELAFETFYATDAFSSYALEFIRQARASNAEEGESPWFLYLAHSAPHFPVQAPKETVDRHVEVYRRGWDVLRDERFGRMQENGLADASWTLTPRSVVPVDRDDIANGYAGQVNPSWDDLPEDRREDLARRMAVYAAMIEHLDRGLGRILDDLESHGDLENTLILLTSDNGACYEWGPFGFDGPSRRAETVLHTGEALGSMGGPGTYHAYGSAWANLCNTPLRMYKHFTYEGGTCSPLLAHWPRGIASPGRWVREPVHLMDVMPTLVEVCEARYPAARGGTSITPMEGTTLTPTFRGESLEARPIASEHNGARSLRHGEWKVVWPVRMPWPSAWELYHIATDRTESHDVSSEHPELTSSLASEWIAWAERAKVHPIFIHKPEGTPSVPIAGRPIHIELVIEARSDASSGVLIAQGGRMQGYAVHLDRGAVVFSVRRDGALTSTMPWPLEGREARIEATLDAGGRLVLVVNGRSVATADAGGLLSVQPVDPLDLGQDRQTGVGAYDAPFPWSGVVRVARVNGVTIRE